MKMKQIPIILTIWLILSATLPAQLVSSGKSVFLLNNKEAAPVIELTGIKPEPGKILKTDVNLVQFTGKISSINKKLFLYLNNKEILLSESNTFSTEQLLAIGINEISLKAVSARNLSSEVKFTIDYQPVVAETLVKPGSKYYALIIGISNYSDPLINELDKPVKDAELFYNTITSRYTFDKENIRLLKNATMSDIVSALDYFAKTVRPADNFLIFYAGHGVWNASSEIGYWLPSDAQKTSKLNWFRNSALRDYLREINSIHTLLITDACFGGSILKTRLAFTDATLAVNKLYELPSRKAMTSGTLTVVPDQSAFLKYLIDRLEKNTEKYLSSEQLYSSIRIPVINNSNVVPQFGEIREVGDEGGDFIFILR
jgi:hypothetical protein